MTDPHDLETSLAEMDRKLRELQRELELVSRGAQEPPAPAPAPAAPVAAPAPAAPPRPPAPDPAPPAAPPSPTAEILEQASARVAELSRRIDDLGRLRDDLEVATRSLQEEHRRAEAAAAAAPASPAGGQDAGELVIDAGPFADIATLSAFELGLRRVDGVQDALVRSFEGNRAMVDVRLGRPLDLAAALRATLPFAFDVSSARPGALTLTLRQPTG